MGQESKSEDEGNGFVHWNIEKMVYVRGYSSIRVFERDLRKRRR